jgi:hypothetical protein
MRFEEPVQGSFTVNKKPKGKATVDDNVLKKARIREMHGIANNRNLRQSRNLFRKKFASLIGIKGSKPIFKGRFVAKYTINATLLAGTEHTHAIILNVIKAFVKTGSRNKKSAPINPRRVLNTHANKSKKPDIDEAVTLPCRAHILRQAPLSVLPCHSGPPR